MQEAGAREGDEGSLRVGAVAHYFLDERACVGVSLERGFGVGELACFGEDVGNAGDAIGLLRGFVSCCFLFPVIRAFFVFVLFSSPRFP